MSRAALIDGTGYLLIAGLGCALAAIAGGVRNARRRGAIRGVAGYLGVLMLIAGFPLLIAGPVLGFIGWQQAGAPAWQMAAFPAGGLVALAGALFIFRQLAEPPAPEPIRLWVGQPDDEPPTGYLPAQRPGSTR